MSLSPSSPDYIYKDEAQHLIEEFGVAGACAVTLAVFDQLINVLSGKENFKEKRRFITDWMNSTYPLDSEEKGDCK